jgi:hypothetical protein
MNIAVLSDTHGRVRRTLEGTTLVLNPGALYRARPHSLAIVQLPAREVTILEFWRFHVIRSGTRQSSEAAPLSRKSGDFRYAFPDGDELPVCALGAAGYPISSTSDARSTTLQSFSVTERTSHEKRNLLRFAAIMAGTDRLCVCSRLRSRR